MGSLPHRSQVHAQPLEPARDRALTVSDRMVTLRSVDWRLAQVRRDRSFATAIATEAGCQITARQSLVAASRLADGGLIVWRTSGFTTHHVYRTGCVPGWQDKRGCNATHATGESLFRFSYRVSLHAAEDAPEKSLPYGADLLRVVAEEGGLRVSGSTLTFEQTAGRPACSSAQCLLREAAGPLSLPGKCHTGPLVWPIPSRYRTRARCCITRGSTNLGEVSGRCASFL